MLIQSVFLVLRHIQAQGNWCATRICFQAQGNRCEVLSHSQNVERSLSKGKRNRELESMQLSQMEKEKILSEQESFMNSLKRKQNELFKENLRLRQDCLKHRLKLTARDCQEIEE